MSPGQSHEDVAQLPQRREMLGHFNQLDQLDNPNMAKNP